MYEVVKGWAESGSGLQFGIINLIMSSRSYMLDTTNFFFQPTHIGKGDDQLSYLNHADDILFNTNPDARVDRSLMSSVMSS